MKKHCSTKEPSLQIKKEIVEYINSYKNNETKTIRDDETITIKLVYHICYTDSNENIERDILHPWTFKMGQYLIIKIQGLTVSSRVNFGYRVAEVFKNITNIIHTKIIF